MEQQALDFACGDRSQQADEGVLTEPDLLMERPLLKLTLMLLAFIGCRLIAGDELESDGLCGESACVFSFAAKTLLVAEKWPARL